MKPMKQIVKHWPSIHIYNRCDGFWDISDGSDEMNCDSSPLLNCSSNHHICVSPRTNELICLSMEKVGDGIVDCIGAADEPTLCQSYFRGRQLQQHFIAVKIRMLVA